MLKDTVQYSRQRKGKTGGGEREKMRQLFPNSSRERRREGKGEELREGLCIVSSPECSKWWQFFSFLFFFTVLPSAGEEPERRAQIGTAGVAVKEKLERTPEEEA